MEGGIYLEAKVLGYLIRKPFFATESPLTAPDNLVYSEIGVENIYSTLGNQKTLINLIRYETQAKFFSTQLLIFPEYVLVQHQFL
tara:strand:+ start:339 stop:593 length:255 start_codon:yes stop_codon:yes gene_type:complete